MSILKVSRCAGLILLLSFLATSGPGAAAQDPQGENDPSKEVEEVYRATKDYTFEKKDEFFAWAEKRSKELESRAKELEQDIRDSSGPLRERLNAAWLEVRERQKNLERELAKARRSAPEAWEETKKGFARALADLEQAYSRAREKFREGEKESRN